MSLSGITFGGLSSGIDTSSIIDKLLQLESRPLRIFENRIGFLKDQQGVLGAFKSALQAMSTSALGLNAPLAFNPIKANSSDPAVATINASTGATAGIYNLSVKYLAQTQKIASSAQADTTTALAQTGTFVVNGKTVQVVASDSLQKVAQNINSANAGVTASLIDGGAGRAYLTISANGSGTKNKIQIADVTGSVLGNLGVLAGAPSPRETITDGVTSFNFSSKTQTLGELLPNSGLTTADFDVNGTTVNVDFTTDTLQTLAAKLTTAGSASTVRTVTDAAGITTYKLDIVSSIGGDIFTDGQNVLQALGVLQQAPASELIAAQDADFKIDGVQIISSSNAVTTAIPGATITLLKADATTPSTTLISLNKDADAIKTKIKGFADAYNNVIDFVNQYSQFDKDTFQSGPLFGDPVARQVVGNVASLLFSNMPGATGIYKNLASIGFGLDEKGKITVDDAKLTTSIANAADSLSSLFQTMGSATGADLNYIAAGNTTKSGTYNVQITALATYSSYVAATVQSAPTSTTENLTFSGTLFGTNPITLSIPQNTDEAGIISLINNDSRLNTLIEASDDGSGHLKITSKKVGTVGNFTVSSDLPNAGGDSSGIGDGTDGTKVLGEDLQGTINGEPATGNANGMLTGNTGNATTGGLQIQYLGSSLGLVGTITVNKAMSATITDLIAQFTDPISGLLTGRDKALTAQQSDITESMTRLQTRLASLQSELQLKFAKMETVIAQLQQQGQQMASSLKAFSSNNG
jgi:flagellar hook-associated protein 2